MFDSDSSMQWYAQLEKPFFAPPAWLFGPAWTFLYILIAISFSFAFYKVLKKEWPAVIAVPFIINLISNAIYSPIQFGLRSNLLASVDILIVLASIVWLMIAAWPRAKWVTYMQIPYLLWVSFATVLQLTITGMNW